MVSSYESLSIEGAEGLEIFVHKWSPKEGAIRGVLQIAHGMAEHGARYRGLASFLNKAGYVVYANDHRGHGKSAESIDLLGYLGPERGFELLIEDINRLNQVIRRENPRAKLFLLGHSMGSFASQRYIMDYPRSLDGLILSGSNGSQGLALKLGQALAKIQVKVKGDKEKSPLLNSLSFGSYNRGFKPNRTEFDWLNRVEGEVDAYIQDPLCGQVFPASFYLGFFRTLEYIESPKNFPKIPLDLPILLVAGQDDPVGKRGRGVEALYQRYLNQGVEDLEIKLYPQARHEILLEENKEEVMGDILEWMEERI